MNFIIYNFILFGIAICLSNIISLVKKKSKLIKDRRCPDSRSVFKAKKNNAKCNFRNYYVSNITFVLFIPIQFLGHVYLLVKYNQPEFDFDGVQYFLRQNEVFMFFTGAGILLYYSVFRKFHFIKDSPDQSIGKSVIWGLLGFAIIAVVQFIVFEITKASVSQFDLYVFFLATAISEEFLFRLGLQLFLDEVFRKRVFSNSGRCGTWSAILSISITSLGFGLYHIFVKGGDLTLILSVTATGFVLGWLLNRTKSFDVVLIAHTVTNLVIVLLASFGFSLGFGG